MPPACCGAATPLGDLPVELETSQGYQQVGATVDSRSISGVTRTITGRILRNQPTTASASCGTFLLPASPAA